MNLVIKIVKYSKRITQGFSSRWRNLYYRALGVKLKGYIWLREIEIPRNYTEIEIEANCALDRGVTLLCSGKSLSHPKIIIGASTYLNRHAFIDAILSLKIGRDCAVGPGCYLTDHDHGLDPELTPLKQPMFAQATVIGDRVWLGANVTVLKGVTIGNDAVIGAGSVVTKDIPESAIAVGIPAKVIKYKQQKESLLSNKTDNHAS
ncbi:acetyltransferase (isoleucine patch superfamily) [Xenococcus sp. PCC 7305]|uniref:acyltransferase n=1 Tax=Xenococcus sp. PCC 7305 TaxID=102125 RepID=UPI0002ABBF4D|nr:acyltransferase [Xenococcus sp. PCC 7305]ELS02159.1 acetyltransferase (isoleucine patch superfamily) [Xenococcus sp. PCC 7305]